jgi:hypothetical protein
MTGVIIGVLIGIAWGAWSLTKQCPYCGKYGRSRLLYPVCPRCGRDRTA